MRPRVLLSVAVLWVLPLSPLRAGLEPSIDDPAALVPAKTLAYAELRQPGQLAKEIASLFEGSALGNVPDSLAKFRAKYDKGPSVGPRSEAAMGVFGLMMAPEIVKEVQRLRGAAFALTGIGKQGQPQFVVMILPGESNAPGLLMRSLLTVGPTSPAGEVEGVRLYRLALYGAATMPKPSLPPPRGGLAPPPLPEPPGLAPAPPAQTGAPAARQAPRPPGARPPVMRGRPDAGMPVFAMMPDLLVFGTPDAVKDVIRRAKGKLKDDTLAGVDAYGQASKQVGDKPGLFAYAADVPRVFETIKQHAPLSGHEKAGFATIERLVNPRAFGSEAVSYTLQDGTLRYRAMIGLNPKEKSPLLDVLPDKPLDTALLHFMPKDALFAAAVSNADGEKRWDRLLRLADRIAKEAAKDEPAPSEQLEKMEKALGLKFGKDIAGKITAVGVAMGNPLTLLESRGGRPPDAPPVLVILRATDADAAESLVKDVIPKVIGAMAGENAAEPTSKEVGGHTVYSTKLHGNSVHYGRHEATLVFGHDRAAVAAALQSGAKKQGLLADKKVHAAVAKLDGPIALVVSKPLPSLAAMASMVVYRGLSAEVAPPAESTQPSPPRGVRPLPPQPRPAEAAPPQAGTRAARAQDAPPEDVVRVGPDESAMKMIKELMKLGNQMDPFMASITRKPDRIVVEARQGGLKPALARLTDWALEQYFRSSAPDPRGFGPGPRPGGGPGVGPAPQDSTRPARPDPEPLPPKKVEPPERPEPDRR
ncbi:MAG TPA: hypothetical protein VG013_38225 [Gemmataceae bacterium]|nr:hypothetical protein [Gemmataceae bacterium]